jgi:hypothetical protein
VVWTETWEAPAPFDLDLARAELGAPYGLEAEVGASLNERSVLPGR